MRPLSRSLLTIALLLFCEAALAMRCDGRLVREGDRRHEVLAACGEPAHQEALGGVYLPGLGIVSQEEHWFYNFGPRRLQRIVRFREGRIASIDTAGYGFRPDVRGECRPQDLRPGMTKPELLARCGDPIATEQRLRLGPAHRARADYLLARPLEEWIYDFGPGQFQRVVHLEGGIVQEIELGSRP